MPASLRNDPTYGYLVPAEMFPDSSGWKGRHLRAVKSGHPISTMINALASYAVIHAERYSSPLADDYVLGPAWKSALRGVRVLLNGEIGTLDAGTCDAAICDIYGAAGFEGEL